MVLSPMAAEFEPIVQMLKSVLSKHAAKLHVQRDTPGDYMLLGNIPSPLPQHKGTPMYFAQVRAGKAYVAFHLMPLYMNEELTATISPALKKRMQGKSCFNFKSAPEPELVKELKQLTDAGFKVFREKKWI